MTPVDLSVIICTLNRSSLLKKCLESLSGQHCLMWTFEVVVVDNGSTDDTKVVAESFASAGLKIRYLFEVEKRIGHTRNVGFRASQGRYVAYLDDDTIPNPSWCAAVCETLDQIGRSPDNKVAVVGGPIDPIFETGRPPWLTRELGAVYAIVDMGEQSHLYPNLGFPLSANMAFVRSLIPEPPWNDRLLMYEDVELGTRLSRIGFKFLYAPKMRVQHFISAKRLNREWLLKRYFAEGIAQEHLPLGILHKMRVTIAAFVKFPFLLVFFKFGSEGRKLKFRCKARFYCGYLTALIGLDDLNSTGYISARREATF